MAVTVDAKTNRVARARLRDLINGVEVRQKGQSECFGESELENSGTVRLASVMALEPTVLATVSRF